MISFGNFFRVSRPAGNPVASTTTCIAARSPERRRHAGRHAHTRPPGARPVPGPGSARRGDAQQHTGTGGAFCVLLGSRAVAGALFTSSGLVRAGLLSLAAAPGARRGGGTRAACSVAAASRQLATNGCTRRESKSAAFLTLRPRGKRTIVFSLLPVGWG